MRVSRILSSGPSKALLSVPLLALLLVLGACSSSGPKAPVPTPKQPPGIPPATPQTPSQTPQPAPVPAKPVETTKPSTAIELEAILGDEVQVWKRQYLQRVRLARSCPTSTSFSYGMRLMQPSTFKGEYAETVRNRYGSSSDFVVLAVVQGGAAQRAGMIPGDRISKIHYVSADQVESAKRVATDSKTWATPYTVDFERDGKVLRVRLTPDRLCDMKL